MIRNRFLRNRKPVLSKGYEDFEKWCSYNREVGERVIDKVKHVLKYYETYCYPERYGYEMSEDRGAGIEDKFIEIERDLDNLLRSL